MSLPFTRLVAAIVLLPVHLVACTEWYVVNTSPRELVESTHPGRVRVDQRDATRMVIDSPMVQRDSLQGRNHGQPAAVAIADISVVAVRKANPVNTLLLVGLAVFIMAGVSAGVGGYDGGSISP